MKKIVMKAVANVAELVCDFGMTTVCSGSWYQPETPEELK
jgi:cyclic lactone autoinducer peptide